MKKITSLIILLFSLNLCFSEVIFSGKNMVNGDVYFDNKEIHSFGSIVNGRIFYKTKFSDSGKEMTSSENYMYLCNSKIIYGYKSHQEFMLNNLIESILDKKSEESLKIIDLSENSINFYNDSWGMKKFIEVLKSRCSNQFQKYPNIKIPIVITSDNSIYYLMLDTFKKSKEYRDIWLERKFLIKRPITGENGTPWKDKNGKSLDEYYLMKEKGTEKTKVNMDCKKESMFVSSYISYNEDGSVSSSNDVNFDPSLLKSIVPDSVGSELYKWICQIL
jgi:hypothetical protein